MNVECPQQKLWLRWDALRQHWRQWWHWRHIFHRSYSGADTQFCIWCSSRVEEQVWIVASCSASDIASTPAPVISAPIAAPVVTATKPKKTPKSGAKMAAIFGRLTSQKIQILQQQAARMARAHENELALSAYETFFLCGQSDED